MDRASPANTCISPSFEWMAPAHLVANRPWKALRGGYAELSIGANHPKEGRIQVLAGLAQSSQTGDTYLV
jgi:hypothetical protein